MSTSQSQKVAKPQVTHEFEEEEVELTDDELVDDGASDTPSSVPVEAVSTPGRVKPSTAVTNMQMRSPDTGKPKDKYSLNPEKNPFTSHGNWSKEDLSTIKIVYPVLSGKSETTNELTRSSRPEARYWKAPIVFNYSTFSSETIRFDNVHIPYHTGKGYGSSFVYICLPGFASVVFADAGRAVAPTRVAETSLVPDPMRWWKIANNVSGSFGVINGATKKFQTKSLETIFDSTNAGLTCSVVLKFYCKASTTDTEPLRPTTPRTVAIEVVRGFINVVDVNVQGPTRIARQKAKIDPVASIKDVASDNLMKRLADLGL